VHVGVHPQAEPTRVRACQSVDEASVARADVYDDALVRACGADELFSRQRDERAAANDRY
jgi:hypothetical protein